MEGKSKQTFYSTPNFSAIDATVLIMVKPKVTLRLMPNDFRMSFIQTNEPMTTCHFSINYLLVDLPITYYLKIIYYLNNLIILN